MKFLIIFFVLIGASLADHLHGDWIRIRAECQIETALSDKSFAKDLLGEDAEDPKVGDHAICLLKKDGKLNKDGELIMDHIRESAQKTFGSNAPKIVEECAVKKSTPGETSTHLIRCWTNYKLKLLKDF